MLRFELHQLALESLGRFYVPLPKLTEDQIRFLAGHLRERGFRVTGAGPERVTASKRGQKLVLEGRRGVAWSNMDLLDCIGPAVPSLLRFPKKSEAVVVVVGGGNPYLSVRRSAALTRVQLLPRIESLRTWTELRAGGLCALTPDEAMVVKRILDGHKEGVGCVSARPREGSSPVRVGRRQLFRTTVPAEQVPERLGRLGRPASSDDLYLPRDPVIRLAAGATLSLPPADDLGEWCYLLSD